MGISYGRGGGRGTSPPPRGGRSNLQAQSEAPLRPQRRRVEVHVGRGPRQVCAGVAGTQTRGAPEKGHPVIFLAPAQPSPPPCKGELARAPMEAELVWLPE